MKKIMVMMVILSFGLLVLTGCGQQTQNTIKDVVVENNNEAPVKEFSMDSFYDENGVWFSLKEITVNKGDRVRIKVTNIKGKHDFVIDEYGINELTPLNEEVVIEFIANEAGEFEYYCSVPGHREKGQWGTLTVLE